MKAKEFAFSANYNRIVFCVFFLFFVHLQLGAQYKYEKECRVKPENVPPLALDFIKTIPLKAKVKWYREEGYSGITYEAKFRFRKRKLSIEFDSTGVLEDVEIEVNPESIDTNIIKQMNWQLNRDCVSFYWHKVQLQFTGNTSELRNVVTQDQVTKLAPSFELVVICKQDSSSEVFMEYVFNPEGRFMGKSEILLRNSSHLEY
jgi:hypothetical protein